MILGHIGRKNLPNDTKFSTISTDGAVFGNIQSGDSKAIYTPNQKHLFMGWGRLDNKSELDFRFQSPPHVADYLYAAYSKWEENCPIQLRGDWGFAYYNRDKRELFLARDHNSTQALFYTIQEKELIFSTSLEPLLTVRKVFNPRFALGILTLWKDDTGDETIFDGIRKVPPGYSLTFKDGKVSLKKYWHLEDIKTRVYSNVQDYSEELLQLTKEAVRCRIEGKNRVASMLSGGLDSSTVSILASQQLDKLTTYSHIPLHQDPMFQSKTKFYDETPYIDKIVSTRSNIQSIRLQSEHISPLRGIEEYISTFNTIMHGAVNAYWIMDLFQRASAEKFDVLLSGKCGNAGISYAGRRELLPLHPSLDNLKQKVLKPMIKNVLEYRQFVQIQKKGYLRKESLRDYGVKWDVLLYRTGIKSWFGSTKEDISHLLKILHRYTPVDSENVFKSRILDPTSDSRIIEYCASIPNHVFFNEKNENKQVLRRMMQGLLPDEVLNEKKKGLQSSDIAQRIRTDIPEIESRTTQFLKNPAFTYLINVDKFQQDVKMLKANQPIHLIAFLKTLMLGVFLEKNGF